MGSGTFCPFCIVSTGFGRHKCNRFQAHCALWDRDNTPMGRPKG